MQFITSHQSNAWKRMPFVAAAAAATLAAGIAVSGVLDGRVEMPAMPASEAPAVSAPQVASMPAFDAPTRQPTYVYIVGSDAAAEELRAGVQDASMLEVDLEALHILVVDSPEEEGALYMLQQEIEQATGGRTADAGVTLIDLR